MSTTAPHPRMAFRQVSSYPSPMGLAGVARSGLATLLVGALPGSPTQAPAPPAVEAVAVVDTPRHLASSEDGVRRDEYGVLWLPSQRVEPRPDPVADLSLEQIHQILTRQPALLGPASIGKPNRGSLLNGAPLPQSPLWTIQKPEHAWGTPALLSCLQRAVEAVHHEFPATPALHVGDLSRSEGGWLRGHRSHQSGLDADIGYYYQGESAWYLKATHRNLDVPRTWALVRALATECDAEYLFIDVRVQALLRQHAEQLGEAPEWLDSLFAKGPSKPGTIRHAWGHQTHIHLRVFDDQAQWVGERVFDAKAWARMRAPSAWAR